MLSITTALSFLPAAGAGEVSSSRQAPAALDRIENDPVRSDPGTIEAVLAACRRDGDRVCQARALLARAEAFAESGAVDRVVEDAAGAEAILRETGASGADLARALLLQRGSGAGGGSAAVEVARRRYEEALALALEAGDLSTAGRLHCEWAKAESGVQNWPGFTEHLDAAAELAGRARLPRVAGCLAYQRGLSRYFQRDPAGAREIWSAFADSGLASEAPRELLWILVGISAASIDMAEHDVALRRARQAVNLAGTLQGAGDAVGAWCNLSTALFFHHRIQETEEAARTCMKIGREAGRPESEALGLLRLGGVDAARGDLTEAAAKLRRSLQIARERRIYPQIPWILLTLGDVLTELGGLAEARGLLEEALDLSDRFGPPPQRAAMRSALSRVLSLTGQADEGRRLAEEALGLLEHGGGPLLATQALRARGLSRYQMQDYQPALEDFEEAAALARTSGAAREEARAAMDAGNALYQLNRLDLALARYRSARGLARNAAARDLEATAAGNILMVTSHYRGALGDSEALLELAREAVEKTEGSGRAVALLNLSGLLRHAGRAEEALAVDGRAREAARKSGIPELEINALTHRALSLAALGRAEEAIQLCDEILDRLEPVSEDMRMRAEFRCGAIHLDTGGAEASLPLLRRALARAEAAGERTTRPDLKAAFIEDRAGFYSTLVKALHDVAGPEPPASRKAEMLSVSERLRSRLLLEALSGSGAAGEEPLGVASMSPADLQASLPGGTAAVEYLLGARASFAFLVTRDRLEVARLPPAPAIDEQVLLFKGLLERRGEDAARDMQALSATGASLYRILLRPLLDRLSGEVSRLVIVPEGSLHHLPFETLVPEAGEPGGRPRYLVEDYRISVIPSLTFSSQLRRTPRPAGGGPALVAFANPARPGFPGAGGRATRASLPGDLPPLPYSESEVRRVAARIGGERRLLTGARASEGALRAALSSGATVIHVAAHGFLDPVSFGRSGILLSPSRGPGEDGLLESRELLDLKVNAGLIVLSGCSTGGGRLVRGEGFLGLPHALFQSGARSIVMSLWAVGDRSAALLMDRFYAGIEEGLEVGEALRRAQLDLIASEDPVLSHPAVWAPFVVTGIDDEALGLPPPEPAAARAWPAAALAALGLGALLVAVWRRRPRRP